MGAVYRATDTKLHREVAIKILPPAFAQEAGRMQRFEREAQVLASLNHPNIAAIYGIEQGTIVMELVEGENLKSPVPMETAVDYARQIASGLEAAHEKGVVHRDLKPANIKVTPEGVVKLLDFGLAKASEAAVSAAVTSPTMSPTLSLEMTQAGMILGTAAYMSPEQARGKAVDKRADIWAFGVVLYEMLTGRRLFEGETTSDTLAAVLSKEPDWQSVPAKAQRMLKNCLEKEPKHRLRDIADAWRLLDEARVAPVVKSSARWRVAAGVLAVVSAISAWGWWRTTKFVEGMSQPAVRADLELGPDISFGSTIGPAVILSPDGTRLVFVSRGKDGTPRLFTQTTGPS
jgi:serine/threonine-protein kinase